MEQTAEYSNIRLLRPHQQRPKQQKHRLFYLSFMEIKGDKEHPEFYSNYRERR